jgi:hypothetical protein
MSRVGPEFGQPDPVHIPFFGLPLVEAIPI